MSSLPLTDEMMRILRAISEGRMTFNAAGRFVIEGEARPDRKSRELLRRRGLIDHIYEQGRGSHWRVTAMGKTVLDGLSTFDRYTISDERLKEIEDLVVFDAHDNLTLAKDVTGDQAAAAIYDLWSERQEAHGG